MVQGTVLSPNQPRTDPSHRTIPSSHTWPAVENHGRFSYHTTPSKTTKRPQESLLQLPHRAKAPHDSQQRPRDPSLCGRSVQQPTSSHVGSRHLPKQHEYNIVGICHHTFSDAEKKWSTIEQEAYAIRRGVNHFEHFVKYRPFTVFTDHANLKYVTPFKDTKVDRWMLYLARFQMTIECISGHDNPLADYLSRCNTQDPNDFDIEIEVLAVPTESIRRFIPEVPLTLPISGRYRDD